MRRRAWRAALGLLLAAAMPATAGAAVFSPETFTLDNGLQVVVVTNRSAPVVSQYLYYKAGAADETRGHSGIAHFLEHLMFRGTTTVADGEFSSIVARHGGDDNAFTSWDYTGYYQTVAREDLGLVMGLEADRMANLVLDDETVRTERSVIIEERRQRIDNNPSVQLGEQMLAALYQNHPYGIPVIGWAQEMAALTPDDARAWYDTWYAPNNAVLVVSGDIDAAELRPLVEQTYGQVPARPVPERWRPEEPQQVAERRVILHHPGVQQPSWRRIWQAPSYGHGQDDMAYALQVLNQLLGGDTTSRLYRTLVVEQGLAVSAGTYYSADNMDVTNFSAYLTPDGGTDLQALEAAFDAQIALLLRDGVTAEEVATAKQRLSVSAIYARDSVAGPAYVLGAALASGRTIAEVEEWPDRIAAVTVDQVMAAAALVLQRERSVTGLLLPEAAP